MTETGLEQLIDYIYEVPLAPDGWMSLAPALQEQFKAPFALLMLHPDKAVMAGACGPLSDEMVNLYSDDLWREDRAMEALRSAPLGAMVLDSRLIEDRERVKSPFYNDFMAPQGLERGLYASVGRGRDTLLIASAQRSARAGDYGGDEINLMKRILPHLHRSFRTWQRLGEVELERQAALDTLEHVAVGVALVDPSGKLHFANRVAEEQISNGALTISNGRVTSRSRTAAQALQEAVRAAARDTRAVADRVTLPVPDAPASSVLVTPVRGGDLAGRRSGNLAMLLIGGQDAKSVEEAAVSRAYGLTPAEARLLAALVGGERIPDYAQRHGISVTTVKTHLKALFDKVGERRQADLIRRAGSDPALRAFGDLKTGRTVG